MKMMTRDVMTADHGLETWGLPKNRTGQPTCTESTLSTVDLWTSKLRQPAYDTWPKTVARSSGFRTAMMVIDVADPSDIPRIAEPCFLGFNPGVTLQPVMNADDLKKGLSKIS
jgi:hypothetical protein